MKKTLTRLTLLLTLLLVIGGAVNVEVAHAQSVNIGGQINIYKRVTAITNKTCNCDPSCKDTITVNNVTGFAPGDRALIIQMKGATINTTNTSAAGAITAINNAGNYEFFIVEKIVGNVLIPKYPLIRDYTPSAAVQVVRIPSVVQANVTAPLLAQEWDDANGVGGVVAVYCRSLNLGADINVLGAGYQGISMNINGKPDNCSMDPNTQWVLPSTDKSVFTKGAGIVVDNVATNRGRAPRANGGGSGASGDTGGGGGSNWGAGGNGGRRWCDVGGTDAGGWGGKTLSPYIVQNKVFMGGAGGPGWVSTNNPSQASDGGGIVIIFADTLIGNGRLINAAGTSPNAVNPAGAPDGGGGGGAGGAVVLKVRRYIGNLTIDVSGGDGQDLNTTIYHGPGGGGGGGTVLYSAASLPAGVTVITDGGIGGEHSDGFRNLSEDGQPGQAFSLYVPIQNPNYESGFENDPVLSECDIDDDNDGILDIHEAYSGDHDGDGVANYSDADFCALYFNGVNGWN